MPFVYKTSTSTHPFLHVGEIFLYCKAFPVVVVWGMGGGGNKKPKTNTISFSNSPNFNVNLQHNIIKV